MPPSGLGPSRFQGEARWKGSTSSHIEDTNTKAAVARASPTVACSTPGAIAGRRCHCTTAPDGRLSSGSRLLSGVSVSEVSRTKEIGNTVGRYGEAPTSLSTCRVAPASYRRTSVVLTPQGLFIEPSFPSQALQGCLLVAARAHVHHMIVAGMCLEQGIKAGVCRPLQSPLSNVGS